MKIGTYLANNAKNKITEFLYSYIGTMDLHSHMRLKPIFKYLHQRLYQNSNLSILEVGCGDGIIPLQLLEDGFRFKYIGIDKDLTCIDSAKLNSQFYKKKSVEFYESDVNSSFDDFKWYEKDIILLVDIIEHLENPKIFLKEIMCKVKKDCVIIISVPTPTYPKIFGKKFHLKVGHLIDGYTIQKLDDLFSNSDYKIKDYKYNTGLLSNIGCAIYYRLLFSSRLFILIKSILLFPIKYFDFFNNERISCSLFAIYERNK